jgi:ketosteroid isomerase-like protein
MKTQRRVAIVKEWFALLGDGHFEPMHQHHSDDVVWELMPGAAENLAPWFGVFERREGVEECLRHFSESVDSERVVIEEPLVGDDDRITVPGYCDFVARATGRRFRIEFVEYFRFRGDKITLVKVYGDTAAAAEAFRED